jgi:L-lactate dehydrogenase complex protein LldF
MADVTRAVDQVSPSIYPPIPVLQAQPFPEAAHAALANTQLRRNLAKATTTIRDKRARVVAELPDWEQLRAAGAAIKTEVLRHLDRYLLQLEEAVTRAGGVVHWARDAAEANAIITKLVQATGAQRVVKVKSLTTDEIGVNSALRDAGITAIETDLAELIIQLAGEPSSHILVPAIHKNRSEIRDLFRRTIAQGEDLSDEPRDLAAVARRYLRAQFLSAHVAISGANFGVAETGTIAVVESEGNGRMCLTLPQTLITVMGIEKLLPRFEDFAVFLQLLPRSATGERMNPYTSLWTGVTPGDGPHAFHLVLLDNGRTRVLADAVGRQTLRCIRCSACLNICPVYARVGGHSYGSVYPGPIGAILTPQLQGLHGLQGLQGRHGVQGLHGLQGVHGRQGAPHATTAAKTLPYASSLCGACYEVCPVQINIPEVLLQLRGAVVAQTSPLDPEAIVMRQLARIFASQRSYEWAQRLGRSGQRLFLHGGRGGAGGVLERLPGPLHGWSQARDLQPLPQQSFRSWWRDREHQRQRQDPEKERV